MDANALSNAISAYADVPRNIVDRVLCALQETVRAALRRNEDVTIAGFGVWNRPIRHPDTPDFSFLVPVGPLAVDPPVHLKDECRNASSIYGMAEYLMTNPVLEETFGADRDPFPDLQPNLHPGVVTSHEVYSNVLSGVRPAYTAVEIGERMVENMKVALGADS